MPIFKPFYRAPVFFLGSAILLASTFFVSGSAFSQEEILDPAAASMATQVTAQEDAPILAFIKSGTIEGVKLLDKKDVLKFYQEHQGKFLWVREGRFSSDSKKLFALIRDSYTHGLNPENYQRTILSQMIDSKFSDEIGAIKAELLMTNAVIHYGADISGMRISAKLVEADMGSWSKGVAAYSLLNVISRSDDPARVLSLLAPQDEEYESLRKELKNILDQYAENAKSDLAPIPLSGLIRQGQSSPVVAQIRERLGVNVGENAQIYDEKLVEAVTKFQIDHGLKADGVIGPRTVQSLNEGPRDHLIKVLANLERRRWVRRPMPGRYVEVNIPAMWLRAVDNSRVEFEMPVIVGRKKRPTMSFVDEIVGIRFNPSWYVPDTIKKEDYLPALKKDPQALSEKGIAFRIKAEDGSGMVTVPPEEIDWESMSERDLKSIQMVQGPGAANALGVIRVLMPNRYDIYLHDTNTPSLFKKDDRAQSSGCVRLAEPRRIANFILGDNKHWSEDRLDSYLKAGKTREISASNPLPVYLFYYTIWKDADGKLVYGQDIYALDKTLVNLLKNNGQIDFPML